MTPTVREAVIAAYERARRLNSSDRSPEALRAREDRAIALEYALHRGATHQQLADLLGLASKGSLHAMCPNGRSSGAILDDPAPEYLTTRWDIAPSISNDTTRSTP